MRAVYTLDESRRRGPSSPERVRLLKVAQVRRWVVEEFEASQEKKGCEGTYEDPYTEFSENKENGEEIWSTENTDEASGGRIESILSPCSTETFQVLSSLNFHQDANEFALFC